MKIHSTALTLFALSLGASHATMRADSHSEQTNALHQAIAQDSKEDTQKHILSAVSDNLQGETASWALLKAIINKQTDQIKESTQKNIVDSNDSKVSLLWAIVLERPNAIKAFLECGAKIDAGLVQYAIKTNRTETALILVKGGVDISKGLDTCMSLCLEDTSRKDVESTLALIEELIKKGYPVNNIWEQCPAVYDAFEGKALQFFLQHNATKPKQSAPKNLTLLNSLQRKLIRYWKNIRNTGSQIRAALLGSGETNTTPLFLAIKAGDINAVEKLITAGANINQKCVIAPESKPITPLAFAVEKRQSSIVKLLLTNGAQYKTQ